MEASKMAWKLEEEEAGGGVCDMATAAYDGVILAARMRSGSVGTPGAPFATRFDARTGTALPQSGI